MCEGMAIANVLVKVPCPKKNDDANSSAVSEKDPLVNDSVSLIVYICTNEILILLFSILLLNVE